MQLVPLPSPCPQFHANRLTPDAKCLLVTQIAMTCNTREDQPMLIYLPLSTANECCSQIHVKDAHASLANPSLVSGARGSTDVHWTGEQGAFR